MARGTRVLTPRLLVLLRVFVMLVCHAFAAALEATPVSVCVTAEFWNDVTGVLSDRHPEEQFLHGLKMPVDFVPSPVFQYVPRFSGGVNSGVSEVVSAVKIQDLCGSCSACSVTQAVELQLVLTSGGLRVDLTAQWILCPLHLWNSTLLAFPVASIRVSLWWSVPSSIRDCSSCSVFCPCGGIAVGAVFG